MQGAPRGRRPRRPINIDRLLTALEESDIYDQEALAREISVAPSTIGRWLSGENRPHVRDIKRVAEKLCKPLDYFYHIEEKHTNNLESLTTITASPFSALATNNFDIKNAPDLHLGYLLEYITKKKPKEIKFYHFSGTNCQHLTMAALDLEIKVQIYIKDPEFHKEKSTYQSDRTASSLNWYKRERGISFSIDAPLQIFLCRSWPLIRATVIDRDLICIGAFLIQSRNDSEWSLGPSPEILIRRGFREFDALLRFLDSYERTLFPEELKL